MPSSTTSTFVPHGLSMPSDANDIESPEDFIRSIIKATRQSDLTKTIIDPKSYKIIGAIVPPGKDIDSLHVSEAYKIILKNRGRHVNQDIRTILKMISEMYVLIKPRGGTIEDGVVMSMYVGSLSATISTKPSATFAYKPLRLAEAEHMVTIRYRLGTKVMYIDMSLREIIITGVHLLPSSTPHDAFAHRHISQILALGPRRETFMIRNIATDIRNVFGPSAHEFDRAIKRIVDDSRPVNVIILTEHVTTVYSFLHDILKALFGVDAHLTSKSSPCNYLRDHAKCYTVTAAEYEEEYGPPGIVVYTPKYFPAAIEEVCGIFSSITVVTDLLDADEIDDVERIIIAAEPRVTYRAGRPSLKDVHDYVNHIRNIDTESEDEKKIDFD